MEIHVQADPPRPNEQLDPWGCILRFLSFVDQFCVELIIRWCARTPGYVRVTGDFG